MERISTLSKISNEAKKREEEERLDLQNNPLFKLIDSKLKIPKMQKMALYAKLSNQLSRGGQLPKDMLDYLGAVSGGASIYSLITNTKGNIEQNKKATSDYVAASKAMRFGKADTATETKASVGRSMKNLGAGLSIPWLASNAYDLLNPGSQLLNPALKSGMGAVAMPGMGIASGVGGIGALGAQTGTMASGALGFSGSLLNSLGLNSIGGLVQSGAGALAGASTGPLGILLGMASLMGISKGIGGIRDKWINNSSINKYKNTSIDLSINIQHPLADPMTDSIKSSYNAKIMMLVAEQQMTPAEAIMAQIMTGVLVNTYSIPNMLYEMQYNQKAKDSISGNKLQNNLYDSLQTKGITDKSELNTYLDDNQLSTMQKVVLGFENTTAGISDFTNSFGKLFNLEKTTSGYWERKDESLLIDPDAPNKAVAREFNISLGHVNLLHKDFNEVMASGKDYNSKMLALTGGIYEQARLIATKTVEANKGSKGSSLYGFLSEQQKMQQETIDEMNSTFVQQFVRPIDEALSRLPVYGQIAPLIHMGIDVSKKLTAPIDKLSNWAEKIGEDSKDQGLLGGVLSGTKRFFVDGFKDYRDEFQTWANESLVDPILNNESLLREKVGLQKMDNNDLYLNYMANYYPDDIQTMLEYLHNIDESTAWVAKVNGIQGRSQFNKQVLNEYTGEKQSVLGYNKYIEASQDLLKTEMSRDVAYTFSDQVKKYIAGVSTSLGGESIDETLRKKEYISDMLDESKYKVQGMSVSNTPMMLGTEEDIQPQHKVGLPNFKRMDKTINKLAKTVDVLSKNINPVPSNSTVSSSVLVELRAKEEREDDIFILKKKMFDLAFDSNWNLNEIRKHLVSGGSLTPEDSSLFGGNNFIPLGMGGKGGNGRKSRKGGILEQAKKFFMGLKDQLKKGIPGVLKILGGIAALAPALGSAIANPWVLGGIALVGLGYGLYNIFENEIDGMMQSITESSLWKDSEKFLSGIVDPLMKVLKPLMDIGSTISETLSGLKDDFMDFMGFTKSFEILNKDKKGKTPQQIAAELARSQRKAEFQKAKNEYLKMINTETFNKDEFFDKYQDVSQADLLQDLLKDKRYSKDGLSKRVKGLMSEKQYEAFNFVNSFDGEKESLLNNKKFLEELKYMSREQLGHISNFLHSDGIEQKDELKIIKYLAKEIRDINREPLQKEETQNKELIDEVKNMSKENQAFNKELTKSVLSSTVASQAIIETQSSVVRDINDVKNAITGALKQEKILRPMYSYIDMGSAGNIKNYFSDTSSVKLNMV